MKIDTSSYYPESPQDDDNRRFQPGYSGLFPDSHAEKKESEPATEPESIKPQSPEEPPRSHHDDKDDGVASPIDSVATALSWILVPLLMPVFGIILVFGLSILQFTPFATRLSLTGVVFAFNVLVPMLLILLLKKLGYVHDIGLNEQKERALPYIITLLCMAGTAAFFAFKGAPIWVVMFFAGGCLAALINFVVNFKWKISAHAAGIAGIVGMLLHIINFEPYYSVHTFCWLIISIALAGLLGSARIWLGRHTLLQVLAGYLVGFCSVYFLSMI